MDMNSEQEINYFAIEALEKAGVELPVQSEIDYVEELLKSNPYLIDVIKNWSRE